jgi:hypothetical protein
MVDRNPSRLEARHCHGCCEPDQATSAAERACDFIWGRILLTLDSVQLIVGNSSVIFMCDG